MKLQKWALFIEAYCIIFNFLIIIKPIFQIITEHLLWKTMKAEHQELIHIQYYKKRYTYIMY